MGDHTKLLGSLALGVLSAAAVAPSVAATTAPPTSEPGGSQEDAGTPANGFSVLGALATIPDDIADDAYYISVGDLDAATAAAGLTRPTSTNPDDVIPWLMALTGMSLTDPTEEPEYAPIPVVPPADMATNAAMSDEITELIGFSLVDAAWVADADAAPSGFSVFAGDFDDATLPADLVDLGGGIVSLGEGEDFSVDLEAINVVSRIGQPQRLAVRDGMVVMSPSTPLVRDWLAGPAETAADDAELAAIAQALDDRGAVSAIFAELGDIDESLGGRLTPAQREKLMEQLGVAVLDDPFESVGVGWSAVDGESVITIVYHLDDDADPGAATDRLRAVFEDGVSLATMQPISELLELDDVTVDGSLVIATTHPGVDRSPWTVFDMMLRQDLPFATVD